MDDNLPDNIPFRDALLSHGFDDLDTLPPRYDLEDAWERVQNACNLSLPQINKVRKFLFPPNTDQRGSGATITQVQFADLMEKVDSIQKIVPVVYKMSIERNNLWTASKINGKRGDTYRKDLMMEMGYTNKKSERPKCMISGMRAGGDKVVCGHIVPCGSELVKLNQLGITKDDLNSTKNCVFWCIGFEHAYESLQISFVKYHPLQDKLYLKFWNEEVKTEPIWNGASQLLGEFDGAELNLDGHIIMRRGLSYQAYQAYLHSCEDDQGVEMTCLYGSPGTYKFKSIGTLMEQQYRKDVENETEDMEES